LKALLEPTGRAYAFLRVVDYVDNHRTIKFVFITWAGERVRRRCTTIAPLRDASVGLQALLITLSGARGQESAYGDAQGLDQRVHRCT